MAGALACAANIPRNSIPFGEPGLCYKYQVQSNSSPFLQVPTAAGVLSYATRSPPVRSLTRFHRQLSTLLSTSRQTFFIRILLMAALRPLMCLFILCTVLLSNAAPLVCHTFIATFPVVNRLCQSGGNHPKRSGYGNGWPSISLTHPISPLPSLPHGYRSLLNSHQVRGMCSHIRRSQA